MAGFATVRLADVAEVKGGKRLPPHANLVTTPTVHPYIRGRDIRDGKITFDDPAYVLDEDFEKIKRYTVDSGDVCITIVGNIGDVGITPPSLHRASLTENAVKLVNLRKDVDALFLMYALLTPDAQSQMKLSAAGAAQPKLGIYKVNEIKVPAPALPIQRRIAGILSAYDELIENSQRRIRILESMARALYREWFVHFRFPGHESVPRVPSPLGEIPKGWEVKSLADLMDIRGGSQPPKSEFIYEPKEGYVRLIQIRDYESDSHLTFVRESPKLRMVDSTEIMIARYGASVARICSGLTGAYNVALAKVIPTEPNCQEFLRQFLSADEFQKLLIGMSGRAAQNGFNKSDIAAARVPVPASGSLLEQFERFSVPIRNSILGLHNQIQNLRRTRDLLLPRLLSGQIDVEAIPS